MRDLRSLNEHRTADQPPNWSENLDPSRFGVFRVPSPIDRAPMRIIATASGGWDHVSVSRHKRCPNWSEMSFVATLFFEDDEAAFQLHVPRADHRNLAATCLHWWRPHNVAIPRPPSEFVAVPGTFANNLAFSVGER